MPYSGKISRSGFIWFPVLRAKYPVLAIYGFRYYGQVARTGYIFGAILHH